MMEKFSFLALYFWNLLFIIQFFLNVYYVLIKTCEFCSCKTRILRFPNHNNNNFVQFAVGKTRVGLAEQSSKNPEKITDKYQSCHSMLPKKHSKKNPPKGKVKNSISNTVGQKKIEKKLPLSLSVKEEITGTEISVPVCDALTENFPLHSALTKLFDTKFTNEAELVIINELHKCTNINQRDDFGRTPLHVAVNCSWPITKKVMNVIEKILKKPGIDINIKDSNGRTALHHCVYRCSKLEIFVLLLNQSDIQVDIKDLAELAVIHYIVMKAHNEKHKIIEALLQSKKCNVNIQGKNLMTPLHFAVSKTLKEKMINLLLADPAINVNIQDVFGKTALHYVCSKMKTDKLIALFLNCPSIDVNLVDKNGKAPLHYVAMNSKNEKSLKIMLCHEEIDINCIDKTLKAPLHYCALIKDPAMILLLLNHSKIIVDHVDSSKSTAFHYCASVGCDLEVIEKIFDLSRDIIHKQDNNGDTALIIAKTKHVTCSMPNNDYIRIIKFLEPLYPTTYSREILLDKVKPYELLTDDGYRLLEKLINSNKTDVLTKPEYYDNGKNFLHVLVEKKYTDDRKRCLEIVLENYLIDVLKVCSLKKSPLHYAVKNCYEYVKVILEHARSMDQSTNGITIVCTLLKMKNSNEQTVCHLAATQPKGKELIQLLSNYGSLDLNSCDSKKKTPLHYACSIKNDSSTETILYLLDLGANPNYVDISGMTPLHYCCKVGQPVAIVDKIKRTLYKGLWNHLDSKGASAFRYALVENHESLVKYMSDSKMGLKDYMTVSQLLHSHISKLYDFQRTVKHDFIWADFCRELAIKGIVDLSEDDITCIKSPWKLEQAKELLKSISVIHPELTVEDLINAASTENRGDICRRLNECKDQQILLTEMNYKLKDDVLCCLAIDVAGGNILRSFAEHFELSDTQIVAIESLKVNPSCPVTKMFDIIKVKNPSLNVQVLADFTQSMGWESLKKQFENVIKAHWEKVQNNSKYNHVK